MRAAGRMEIMVDEITSCIVSTMTRNIKEHRFVGRCWHRKLSRKTSCQNAFRLKGGGVLIDTMDALSQDVLHGCVMAIVELSRSFSP